MRSADVERDIDVLFLGSDTTLDRARCCPHAGTPRRGIAGPTSGCSGSPSRCTAVCPAWCSGRTSMTSSPGCGTLVNVAPRRPLARLLRVGQDDRGDGERGGGRHRAFDRVRTARARRALRAHRRGRRRAGRSARRRAAGVARSAKPGGPRCSTPSRSPGISGRCSTVWTSNALPWALGWRE